MSGKYITYFTKERLSHEIRENQNIILEILKQPQIEPTNNFGVCYLENDKIHTHIYCFEEPNFKTEYYSFFHSNCKYDELSNKILETLLTNLMNELNKRNIKELNLRLPKELPEDVIRNFSVFKDYSDDYVYSPQTDKLLPIFNKFGFVKGYSLFELTFYDLLK